MVSWGRTPSRGAKKSALKNPISKYLVTHDRLNFEDRVQYIKALVADQDEQLEAKNLKPGDGKKLVELLDEALRAGGLNGADRYPCVRYLARVCGWHAILPKSMLISDYERVRERSGGGHSIVWDGKRNGKWVVIKDVKLFGSDGEERRKLLMKEFCKEVVLWAHHQHPTILPFIGAKMVVEPGEQRFEMVSECMDNGELGEFIEDNKEADRIQLVGPRSRPVASLKTLLRQLQDIATGLSYLHSQSMVHGDLKPSNIFINKHQRACLADFGLSRILAEYTSSGPKESGGTHAYMSPEMLWPDKFPYRDAKPTKESDIYALGVLIYEVICGHLPHPELRSLAAAMKFEQGELPSRPEAGFTDSLWTTLESCWQRDRERRPKVDAVLEELKAASRALSNEVGN